MIAAFYISERIILHIKFKSQSSEEIIRNLSLRSFFSLFWNQAVCLTV